MNEPLPQTLDIEAQVRVAMQAALDLKAVDLRVLHLEPVTDFTDYFLICSGTNSRQVQAIAESVQRKLRAIGLRPLHAEGEQQARWALLDFGDFVVHAFDEEHRALYALERLWDDAPDVTESLLDD